MLVIDFFSTVNIVDGIGKYTGGANYAKAVIRLIKIKKNSSDQVKILLPVGYKIEKEDEKLFSGNWCSFEYIENIEAYNYAEADKLFLPQVNGTLLLKIPKIKKKNPKMVIYGALHDRQHNFDRYDWLDRKLTGEFALGGFLKFWSSRIIFSMIYPHCIKYIDNVITASNYSMQCLMNNNVKNIKYYIQDIIFKDNEEIEYNAYILLVGGGRPEKNALRCIEAFLTFKKDKRTKTKLVVTGITDKITNKIYAYLKTKEMKIGEDVILLDYVSYAELTDLYKKCKYVVFASKGEGYGLPVREAMNFDKTILASRLTSVPEVCGATLTYFDPFNIESIINGFKFLDDNDNFIKYTSYIKKRKKYINDLSKQDMEILIDDILT